MKDKTFKNIYISITIPVLIILSVLSSCTRSAKEFTSKEELAKAAISLLNQGDKREINKLIVSKEEFVKSVYPHLPESKAEGYESGDDFYRIFIKLNKINALNKKTELYKGRIISLKSVGEPGETIKTGAFSVLKKIPLTLDVRDSTGKTITVTDNEILGAVIEKDGGRCKWLNIFD